MHRPFRFRPPVPAATAVSRARLLGPLARRFEVRLVTIEAGAGFGKTTLLAQALAENALDPRGRDCWLTCEPGDSSASVLLGALLDAIGAPAPDDAPSVPLLCEAVWAAAPEQVCLVLDDAQHLEAGSDGETVVARLLTELPENGHVLVAARRLPPLTGAARLAAQGRVLALHEQDLCLDRDEVESFASRRGIDVHVLDGAAAWPALAELRARTSNVNAERFAWEEVVAPLADAERDAFLLVVAVGGTDADCLDAVVAQPFDRDVLAGLPLVDVDDRGGVRPHALWQELLRSRIDASTASAARQRVAVVLRAAGDHGAAFELLAANGDWDAALEALFAACNDQARPPWRDQMERWRRMVPDEYHARPEVLYADAMVARAGDPWSDEVARAFDGAIAGFRARGQPVEEFVALIRASYVSWMRGDLPALDAMYADAARLATYGIPTDGARYLNRVVAADIRGDRFRDPPLTEAEIEPRLRHFPSLLRVFEALCRGDADSAIADASGSASFAHAVRPAAGTGFAAFLPAAVAWARGDLTTVLGLPLDDPGPRYSIAERAAPLALAAIVAGHLGDAPRAQDHVAAFDALVPDVGRRDLVAGFRALAGAAAAIAAGDESAAASAIDHHLAGRPLDPATTGRALRWWPSLAYLYNGRARALLDEVPSGPARARTLDACRALLSARAGAPWHVPAVLADAPALLAALPAALATELVARIAARDANADVRAPLAYLAASAPDAVRTALRNLRADSSRGVRDVARALLASVPIPPATDVRIEVLGATRLLQDGVATDDPNWRRQRVRQLVCALVAHRELRRARLGALLWPDADADAVSANLRMTLSYTQSLLEPERVRGDAAWFLRQDAGLLRLEGGRHLSVDAWEVEEHLDAAQRAASAGTPSVELDHLLSAVALWQGDYLDDVAGEEWAEPLRERFRHRFVSGAARAAELLGAAGRAAEAERVAVVAIGVDPYAEAAHRSLVRARLSTGDRDGARRAYDACVRRLAELGAGPEPTTAALARDFV